MSQFTNILVVSPVEDGRTWVLVQGFGYLREIEGDTHRIDVPNGFSTDFASVPWLAQLVIPTWGKYGCPAVLHDWMYWQQTTPRQYADETLLDAMSVAGVDNVRKYIIYWAVRYFGCIAWIRNKQDRISGYDRVLPNIQNISGAKSLRVGAFRQVYRALKRGYIERKNKSNNKNAQ